MILDILATNQWERPIYFNNTSLNSIALDLKKSVLSEGQVFRLLPLALEHQGAINLEQMHTNIMKNWQFNDLENEDVYYSHEDYQLRILQATKASYNDLAVALLKSGEEEKAEDVVRFVHSNFVKKNIDHDASLVTTTDLLSRIGKAEDATNLANVLINRADEMLQYLKDNNEIDTINAQIQLFILRQLYDVAIRNEQPEIAKRCSHKYNEFYTYYTRNLL